MINTIETWLPLFPGFYETGILNDNDPEYSLFDDPSNVNDDILEFVNNELYTYIDYETWRCDLAEKIVDPVIDALKEKLTKNAIKSVEFQSLQSPKEYNFATDTINIKIRLDIDNILTYCRVNFKAFTKYIKGRYTSCSGFISHYENDAAAWMDQINDCDQLEHRIGSVLQFICENEEIEFFDVFCQLNENGHNEITEYIDYDNLLEAVNEKFTTDYKDLSDLEKEPAFVLISDDHLKELSDVINNTMDFVGDVRESVKDFCRENKIDYEDDQIESTIFNTQMAYGKK